MNRIKDNIKYIESKKLEWYLYSKTSEYKKNIQSTKTIIKKAFDKNIKWSISWSGGKDSTVMTHMIKSIKKDCIIISQFDDCDYPEKKEYMDNIAKELGWKINRCYPEFKIWDEAIKYKLGIDNICSKNNKLTKLGFLKPLEEKRKELGCAGSFLGLRAAESNKRRISYITHGYLYQLKSGGNMCTPIIYLTVKDIFAYHVENNIEINPCYLKNKYFEPEEIRLSWALPLVYGVNKGQIEHFRYYYSELYSKWKELRIIND